MIITPVQQLIEEATKMQDDIEVVMSDNPSEWVNRGSILCEYMARSGKCLADAKFHLSEKKKHYIVNELTEQMEKYHFSATTQKELINSVCSDLERLVNWYERLNKACTHQLDYIRSLLSKEKAEMQLNTFRKNNS